MLNEIDLSLLDECKKNPGQTLADSVKSLLGKRSRRRLYVRLYALESQHLISVDRTSEKGVALATITEQGRAAIRGREDRLSIREARSS